MPANLPVAFAALLAGGLLVHKGATTTQTAFTGGSTTAPVSAASVGTVPTSGGQQHGLVSQAALAKIGKAHGWTGQQIIDWMKVIVSESNGTLADTNPSSGAYGIAQFINGPSEYWTYHGDPNTLTGQLTAMANYIAERYGNPSAAWAYHQQHNYY